MASNVLDPDISLLGSLPLHGGWAIHVYTSREFKKDFRGFKSHSKVGAASASLGGTVYICKARIPWQPGVTRPIFQKQGARYLVSLPMNDVDVLHLYLTHRDSESELSLQFPQQNSQIFVGRKEFFTDQPLVMHLYSQQFHKPTPRYATSEDTAVLQDSDSCQSESAASNDESNRQTHGEVGVKIEEGSESFKGLPSTEAESSIGNELEPQSTMPEGADLPQGPVDAASPAPTVAAFVLPVQKKKADGEYSTTREARRAHEKLHSKSPAELRVYRERNCLSARIYKTRKNVKASPEYKNADQQKRFDMLEAAKNRAEATFNYQPETVLRKTPPQRHRGESQDSSQPPTSQAETESAVEEQQGMVLDHVEAKERPQEESSTL